MSLKISWTVNGKGGSDKEPSWENVCHFLEKLNGKSGTVTLDNLHVEQEGVESLQLRAEDGYYLVMLDEIRSDEYQVRTLWNPDEDEKK